MNEKTIVAGEIRTSDDQKSLGLLVLASFLHIFQDQDQDHLMKARSRPRPEVQERNQDL